MIKECSTVVVATCLAFAATGSAHAQFFGLQNLLNRASSAAASAPSLDTTTVKMSGDQMLGELRQLRSGFAAGKPPMLFDASELAAATAPSSGGLGSLFSSITSAISNPLAAASSVASSAADRLLDAIATEISYSAISGLLGSALDDPTALGKISIDLPDPARLAPDVRRRVMTMGSYLTALKASNLAIESAEKSLELAKTSYREVLEMRAQQVKLLGEGVFARQGLVVAREEEKARGESLLADEDRAYLARFEGKPFTTMIGDPVAVNIVFNYLRGRDPERFKDYTLKVAEMRSHYDAYVRATVGSASMIGFTGMFVKQARKYADQYKFSGATELAPLLTQAFSEVASTLPRIQRVSQASDGIVEGSFQLERAGQLVNKGSSARTVLAGLDGDAAKRFREMLLPPPGGRGGMLFRLYSQSADAVADILDETTGKDARNQFGKAALQAESDNFLFKNALLSLAAQERQKLGQSLLYETEDFPADAAEEAVAKVQREFAENALNLSNSHLRTLMYAAAPQASSASALRIGDYVLRLENPGVDGIADYERLSQQSLAQAGVRDFARDRADRPAP